MPWGTTFLASPSRSLQRYPPADPRRPPRPVEPHRPPAGSAHSRNGFVYEFAQQSDNYSGTFERIVSRALGGPFAEALPPNKVDASESPDSLPLALPPRIGLIPDAFRFLDLRGRVLLPPRPAPVLEGGAGGRDPLLLEPSSAFPATLSPRQAEAFEAYLLEVHAAVGDGSPGACERLQEALCDTRVLATGLVQDEIGGYRAHRMLQTLRAARCSDAGPHAVASFFVECVSSCSPEALNEEQLCAAVEQCVALLEFGTALVSSTPDLWLLDLHGVEAVAHAMLQCSQRLQDPELHARALVASAGAKAGVRDPLDETPLQLLLEARSILRRHGLVPSRLECEALRLLMNLLSAMRAERAAEARPRRGGPGRAGEGRAAGQGHPPTALHHPYPRAALKYVRHLAEDDLRRRELWAVPTSDYLNTGRSFWLLLDPAALCRMLKLLAVVFKVLGMYRETPQGAHLNFALGDVLAVSGRHAEAAAAYEECIQLYAAFDEYFPPDSRRVVAARRALDASRAAALAAARSPCSA
eukprot:tig00021434_g21353.t1